MDWGKVIMDGITIAIIGVGGVIIGAVISELFLAKKVKVQIGAHSEDSHREHNEIKGEHAAILNNVTATRDMLIKAEANDRRDYESLNEKQRGIIDSVKAVQLLPQELMRLNGEVTRLSAMVESLGAENRELKTKNQELCEQISSLRKQDKSRNSRDKSELER